MTKDVSIITPANIANASFGDKMEAYEGILKEESELQEEISAKVTALKTLLSDTGMSYSESYRKQDLIVFKDKEITDMDILAENLGERIHNVISYSTKINNLLKKAIGREAFDKLKEIDDLSNEDNNTRIKDEVATKKLVEAYLPLAKELSSLANKRTALGKKKSNANEYVSYVRNLAEIAKVTSNPRSEE